MIEIVPLSSPPDAVVRVPGSKSLTNRALVCALLASGRSVITGALDADDTRAMAAALEALGAGVHWEGDTITVESTGTLQPGPLTLHVRDSGTCARFLAPVLALGRGRYVLDGSEQLRRRPMGPMVDALRTLGVRVEGDSLPLVIHGAGGLPDAPVDVPADISSQFISGLLLAGANVRPTGDVVSRPYIEMTEQVKAAFAHGAAEYAVEPDATAASYFFAAAAIFPGGRVRVEGLGRRSVQGDMAFVGSLADYGATVEQGDDWTQIVGPEHLHGPAQSLFLTDTPDVAQTLAIVAAFADAPSVIRGVGFIRGHETDRISAMVSELRNCGIGALDADDGFAVDPPPDGPHGAEVDTHGDHRMAMSFAVLGLRTAGIRIKNPEVVNKTFPGFFSVLESLRR